MAKKKVTIKDIKSKPTVKKPTIPQEVLDGVNTDKIVKGKIKFYDASKGYGFILLDNGSEIFLHRSGIASGREVMIPTIGYEPGDEVEFKVESCDKGFQAVGTNIIIDEDDEEETDEAENQEEE